MSGQNTCLSCRTIMTVDKQLLSHAEVSNSPLSKPVFLHFRPVNLNQRAIRYIRNYISAREFGFAGDNVISYVSYRPLIQISKHLRADVDLNEDPIDINSSDHLRSGWDKSPKETESAYSIASLLYPLLSSNQFIKLDDFFL